MTQHLTHRHLPKWILIYVNITYDDQKLETACGEQNNDPTKIYTLIPEVGEYVSCIVKGC